MKPDDMNYEAKHLTLQHELGEGPLWQPEQGRLFWVNIEAGEVHSCTAAGKDHQVHILPSAVGALAFRKGGGFLLATRDGFAFWNGAQELTFRRSLKTALAAGASMTAGLTRLAGSLPAH